MSEALFKVGGVYRNGHGCPVRIVREEAGMLKAEMMDGYDYAFDFCPFTGKYLLWPGKESDTGLHLIPGELHEVDGQWVPITEQPMAPYFAQAQESEWVSLGCTHGDHPADLAMIARDGEAKESHSPTVIASKEEKLASVNVHAPVKGLTFLGRVDHRLGLGR